MPGVVPRLGRFAHRPEIEHDEDQRHYEVEDEAIHKPLAEDEPDDRCGLEHTVRPVSDIVAPFGM